MRVSLGTLVREWGRIGLIGFGGPPAHVALRQNVSARAFLHGSRAASASWRCWRSRALAGVAVARAGGPLPAG